MDQLSEKNSDDFYFRWEDQKVQFFFNSIDMEKFQKEIEKHNLPKNSLFHQIVVEVEKIRSFGIKGKKRLYVGYNEARKVENRKAKTENRQIYYYAQDHPFKERNNPLPPEFINKIVCADSEQFLKKLPDNCIDLVFTSPPYNFGLDYNNEGSDSVHWTEYLNKLNAILKECIRVLKYGGRMIINVQPLFSDYIPIHHMLTQFMMMQKMIWKGEILWEKNNYNCKYTAWGSWKSPSNPYLKYTWEFLEIFCKGSLKHEGDSELADITPDEFKKWVYAKWSIAPERNMADWGHPAMFPEKLVEQALKLFSFEQDIVLDPFNGVGTTVKVAKDLNRKFIGIDISEEYCKKANERLKSAGHQKRLKVPKKVKDTDISEKVSPDEQ
jgi:DNA modification methylase